MNLSEKAAYLKGLADGLEISDTTKEGKLLKAVVELLDEMANSVSNLEEDVDQIYDELDAVDEDMDDLEEYVFGDEEDYEDEDDEEEDEDEDPYYEITCPKCGETVCVDEATLVSEDLACPNCGTEFEVEFDEDCGEEGCDGCQGCCDSEKE
ncbi:MAG TPA: hypothetical protein H9840_01180 [Candidatus Anaerofilum excrementigallinarum]|nr:hypothetical protein [Candidatus Anaerofilum excrementigallinarum]